MADKATGSKNKELKPFIAPDCREISDEEKKRNTLIERRAAEIGIYFNVFDGDNFTEHENPYRAKALVYIMKEMEVPEELKNKIKEYDRAYQKQNIGNNSAK